VVLGEGKMKNNLIFGREKMAFGFREILHDLQMKELGIFLANSDCQLS
jgi:hypothetical protein